MLTVLLRSCSCGTSASYGHAEVVLLHSPAQRFGVKMSWMKLYGYGTTFPARVRVRPAGLLVN